MTRRKSTQIRRLKASKKRAATEQSQADVRPHELVGVLFASSLANDGERHPLQDALLRPLLNLDIKQNTPCTHTTSSPNPLLYDHLILHRRQENELAPLLRHLSLLLKAEGDARETFYFYQRNTGALDQINNVDGPDHVRLRTMREDREQERLKLGQAHADTEAVARRFSSSLQEIREKETILNDMEVKRLFDGVILAGLFSEAVTGNFDHEQKMKYHHQFGELLASLEPGSRALQHARSVAGRIHARYQHIEEELRVLNSEDATEHRKTVAKVQVQNFHFQGWIAIWHITIGGELFQKDTAVRELEAAQRAERELYQRERNEAWRKLEFLHSTCDTLTQRIERSVLQLVIFSRIE